MSTLAERARFLIVALSGRALAASAARAGYGVAVLDLFDDIDTRVFATTSIKVPGSLRDGFDAEALIACARQGAPADAGLVYGSGLEGRPELLGRLSASRRLFGNPPDVLAAVEDPTAFFALLDDLAIPHPETRMDAPADRKDWLSKRAAAGGGAHIRKALDAGPMDGRYYQRRLEGRAVSAFFVADGKGARVLGYSEQWPADAKGDTPFRFGGAVAPAPLSGELQRKIGEAVDDLAAALGLVGLNSADVIVKESAFHMLEINPRPGATMDIFESVTGPSLFDLHIKACGGEIPADVVHTPAPSASAIVYADRDLVIPPGFSWPSGTQDLPQAGSRIGAGEPVCSVLAEGDDVEAARTGVLARADTVLAALTTDADADDETLDPPVRLRAGEGR